MLDIKTIKNYIETNSLSDYLIVWLGVNKFLAWQYINAIAENKHKTIIRIEDLDIFDQQSNDIFGLDSICDANIYVYETDELSYDNPSILKNKNLFIVANKITDKSKEIFDDTILNVYEIDKWCIKDYAYSKLPGIKSSDIDWLLDTLDYNIYRLDMEIDKFSIFPKTKQQEIFDLYIVEKGLDDISSYTIFNLTNAIITRNKKKADIILSELKNIDVNMIGLAKILHDNFKNIIKIQLDNKSTAESLNMSQKQFIAIKYNCGYFNADELIKIIQILNDIDYKLKTGQLPANLIIDYLIVNILGV